VAGAAERLSEVAYGACWGIWSEPREGGSLLEQALKKSGWRGPKETGA